MAASIPLPHLEIEDQTPAVRMPVRFDAGTEREELEVGEVGVEVIDEGDFSVLGRRLSLEFGEARESMTFVEGCEIRKWSDLGEEAASSILGSGGARGSTRR